MNADQPAFIRVICGQKRFATILGCGRLPAARSKVVTGPSFPGWVTLQ